MVTKVEYLHPQTEKDRRPAVTLGPTDDPLRIAKCLTLGKASTNGEYIISDVDGYSVIEEKFPQRPGIPTLPGRTKPYPLLPGQSEDLRVVDENARPQVTIVRVTNLASDL